MWVAVSKLVKLAAGLLGTLSEHDHFPAEVT